MDDHSQYVNSLRIDAQITLFFTSYTPLFGLIIINQLHNNYKYLHWASISQDSILCYAENFGLSSFLFVLILYGLFGAYNTFNRIEKVTINNGLPYIVTEVRNKNSEAINYIATYIIPFAFQQFKSWYELVSIILIILIIFRIFINSTLLLVNPLLSLKYGLYEIEFKEGDNGLKNGIVITKDRFLVEDKHVKLYPIGHKMYYGIPRKDI